MTFQERVIERFKEFFPAAEIVHTSQDWGMAPTVGFGLAPMKNEGERFLHSCIQEYKNEWSGGDYNAEDQLISVGMGDLYFYREPSHIYIRSIESGCDKVAASVRFSLGYKL